MKKRALLLISFFLVFSSFFVSSNGDSKTTFADSVNDYYTTKYSNNVTGKKGYDLLESLKIITTESHIYRTSYADLTSMTLQSDGDPSIKENIILLYSRDSIAGAWDGGKTWNREHVWPQSLSNSLYGTSGAGSDLHHLRPASSGINSTRGNTQYGEIEDFSGSALELMYNNEGTGNYYISSKVFEPRDDIKGDIARILMYLYTRYYDTGKLQIENVVTTKEGTADAAWNIILNWNELDPVDYLEIKRNEVVAEIQGNRNPYIDHPEFIDMIHDPNYSGEGALLDQDLSENIPVTSVSVSPLSSKLKIGQSVLLSANVLPDNATDKWISWSSSNPQVAQVDYRGKVTALKAGNATITAKIGNYSATSKITVEADTVSYVMLESFNEIDETKDYVLGLDNVGFHYATDSNWGRIALPNVNAPYIYKLTKTGSDTFTASTTINGKTNYLTVPTSNGFSMSTSSTNLKMGTATKLMQEDIPSATICNASTAERHLCYNTDGIRSYATGNYKSVYFYAIEGAESDNLSEDQAEEFMARLIALEGKVTLNDEEKINQIEKDYEALDNKVKTLVDEKGYASKLQSLKNELQALKDNVVVNEIIEAIKTLPNVDEIVDSSYYENYYTKAIEIRTQYNSLNDTQKKLVTNIQKLFDVIEALEKFAPEMSSKRYEFSASSNGVQYPSKTDGSLEQYNSDLAAFKKNDEYILIELDSILQKNDILKITVMSLANSASKTTELTVFGLYNEQETGVSETIVPYNETVNGSNNIKNKAIENAITVQFIIPADTFVNYVKIQDTKHGANVALIAVEISIQKAELSEEEIKLNNLISLMNSLSTCADYKRAPEIRELYNELSDESKIIFDETLCEEDDECTLIFKLEYMEYLFDEPQEIKNPQPTLFSNQFDSSTSVIALISIVGLIGASIYFIYYKRKNNLNEL